MKLPPLSLTLPEWVEPLLSIQPRTFPTDEAKMALVIALADQNIEHFSGGPFGAAIFDSEGALVSVGMNLVSLTNCSIWHAEMVAIALAQQKLQRYDLSDGGRLEYTLAASIEPCAMCFGALPWSGISRLLCGGRDEDARAIGFDEGPKLPLWTEALNERGIDVVKDVLRNEAVTVLRMYTSMGGEIYNAERKQ